MDMLTDFGCGAECRLDAVGARNAAECVAERSSWNRRVDGPRWAAIAGGGRRVQESGDGRCQATRADVCRTSEGGGGAGFASGVESGGAGEEAALPRIRRR